MALPSGTDHIKINKRDFDQVTIEDALRVDNLCQDLLMKFYQWMLDNGVDAVEATSHARGADYFLRDFVVDIKQRNIFSEIAGTVRQFAGNWYIVNTLEPDLEVLFRHLEGVRRFYGFLHICGLISDWFLKEVERECDDHDFYRERLDSFWEIRGDGFLVWERKCSLKDD
jgi:hypothetical protein